MKKRQKITKQTQTHTPNEDDSQEPKHCPLASHQGCTIGPEAPNSTGYQCNAVEHEQIDHKTTEFNKRFYDQLDEYNRAKAKIKELEMSTQHHDQKVERLNDQLEQLSMELADVKKQIHDKGRNMTDATPLVEMRAAIQRLKEENREFDILIGVLYHELTLARKGEGNYKQSEDAESDDGITS